MTPEDFIVECVLSRRVEKNGEPVRYKTATGQIKDPLELFLEKKLRVEEVIAIGVLAQARTCTGAPLDLEWFNKAEVEGGKGIFQLFNEIRLGEAKLQLTNEKRILRTSWSLRLYILSRGLLLRETMRIRPPHVVRKQLKPWSVSEMRRRSESLASVILRLRQQEFLLTDAPDWSEYRKLRQPMRVVPNIHPSSVYRETMSAVKEWHVLWNMSTPRWGNGLTVCESDHTTSKHAWFPPDSLPHGEWHPVRM